MRKEEDTELVLRAQQNKKDFAYLYIKYYPKIYGYFLYRTNKDRELAADLLQETFIRAYTHIATFHDQGYSYLTYLLVIAHNVLVNNYRKQTSIPIENADIYDDPAFDISRDMERESDADLVWKAVRELPVSERDIIFLRYSDELSIHEIASVTGKTENAVKLVLSRGRKRLRAHPYIELISIQRAKIREREK